MNNKEIKKLTAEEIASLISRPKDMYINVQDGNYNGEITSVEVIQRESKYSENGLRNVLNIQVNIIDEDGEPVVLYFAPSITWSKNGKLMKSLKKLDAVPEPEEMLDIDSLVGMLVQVTVENVEKNGTTYSNIIDIERNEGRVSSVVKKKSIINRSKANNIDTPFDDDNISEDKNYILD